MSPLTPSDALIGVVTSRSMTYVLAGMYHARALGTLTIGFAYTNWNAPGNPGICECVVKCDPWLEREGESSETEKNREIRSVLIKLSQKLGESTRTSEGTVETGVPDERDNDSHPPTDTTTAFERLRPASGSRTIRRDPDLMPAIGLITTRLKQGGRLIYIGAGAADCLGVLDAAELPREFSTSPASFIKLIAGGGMVVEHAARDAEDSLDAVADLAALKSPLTPSDALIGAATSRSMTYVLAGISHARALGALTIGFTSAPGTALGDPEVCECVVECITFPNHFVHIMVQDMAIRSVLINLSNGLGESTRAPERMIQTGTPDGRDKDVAHSPYISPYMSPISTANFRTIQPRPMFPGGLAVHTKTESWATVAEREHRERPVLPLEDRHDTTTSNNEPEC
ncbi:hypothetical protein BD779DRAFT_1093048 [Infundibulicybe gibba]|nr:hypothetical protein BD779DRAFT_1093048 [Infundibulicybe gibba]